MVYAIDIIYIFSEILLAPIRHPVLLWILIPVYINWIIGDLYQEKKGTRIGSAISNGFVALWVGLDWGKQLTRDFIFSIESLIQLISVIFFITYGSIILFEGVQGKKIARYIGRVREVTYIIICFTPIFHGFIPLNLYTIIAIVLFFPIFYFVVEIIMVITPSPLKEEEE